VQVHASVRACACACACDMCTCHMCASITSQAPRGRACRQWATASPWPAAPSRLKATPHLSSATASARHSRPPPSTTCLWLVSPSPPRPARAVASYFLTGRPQPPPPSTRSATGGRCLHTSHATCMHMVMSVAGLPREGYA
jgi:hypothetical protein